MLSALGQQTDLLSPTRLYYTLEAARDEFLRSFRSQIVRLTFDIPAVDPLEVFAEFSQADRLSFYFEKPDRRSAVAAFDRTVAITAAGADRFLQAKAFAHKINGILRAGADRADRYDPNYADQRADRVRLEASGPSLFCAFPFLDEPRDPASPFGQALVFLPRWQVMRRTTPDGTIATFTANVWVDGRTDLDQLCAELWQPLDRLLQWRSSASSLAARMARYRPTDWELAAPNDPAFLAAARSALQDIADRRFCKVVLARAIDWQAPEPLDPALLLHNLRQRHPGCYTFAVGNSRAQTFLGASPECLVAIDRGRIATEALAGSAPRGATPELDRTWGDRLLNNPKELHEHRLVADFIADRLAQLGAHPKVAVQPGLRKLSNIQHLQTPICGRLPRNVDPLDVVAALHPTPAVAGLSRSAAIAAIDRYEPFERSLYAGAIGWLDAVGNAEFAVGIRSALIQGDRARLFAGAGIVAGSDPERELAEIQLKLQALWAALI